MTVSTPSRLPASLQPLRQLRQTTKDCLCACAVTALLASWLTFSDMQRLNNADSLMPAFVSLYRWTWFYWGQNRFGMLTALLALPVRHPLFNLLLQNWITSFCGLMVFPLVHANLLGWRDTFLSSLVGATVFLLSAPIAFHMDFLLACQPYALSTALALLGMLAMKEKSGGKFLAFLRAAMSAMLFFLSFWVSLAAVFLILPLFMLQSLAEFAPAPTLRKRLFIGCAHMLPPALLNALMTWSFPGGEHYQWTTPSSWPGNCAALLQNTCHAMPPAFIVTFFSCLAGGAIIRLFGRPLLRTRRLLYACAIPPAAASTYFLLAAATDHVRESGFPYRYAIPTIVFFLASAAMALSLACRQMKRRWQTTLKAIFLLALLIGISYRYGTPSYRRVRQIMDTRFGNSTPAILADHCTHVLGNYWDVWGIVFHANLVNYETNSHQTIWAIADRAHITRDIWFPSLRGARIAVPRSEKSTQEWEDKARQFQLPPLRLKKETPEIREFEPM